MNSKISQARITTTVRYIASLCIGLCLAVSMQPSLANHNGVLSIDQAKWNASRKRVEISGLGDQNVQVVVTNAYDSKQLLGTASPNRRHQWKVTKSNPVPVPCRVRAVQNNGKSAERNVDNAPANCAPKAPQPVNRAPTAGNDSYSTDRNTLLSVNAPGVLGNDSDPDGEPVTAVLQSGTAQGTLNLNPDGSFSYMPAADYAGPDSFTYRAQDPHGAQSSVATVNITVLDVVIDNTSINSTSSNAARPRASVAQKSFINTSGYRVLAANDLGMHCADQDYQVFSILPPFNVIHAQVLRRGTANSLPSLADDASVDTVYSAAANPNDPALATIAQPSVYKSNFWADPDQDGRTLGYETYAPLFFGLLSPAAVADSDVGLPAPDSNQLPICLSNPATCGFAQQLMPGITAPYTANQQKTFDRFDRSVNFFSGVLPAPLGRVVSDANWWAADGIPILPVDDQGRVNAYPMMRVQAVDKTSRDTLASLDIVLPVASEADCQGCHTDQSVCDHATALNLTCNGFAASSASVAFDYLTSATQAPGDTPEQRVLNAAKINILRLHDAKHGTALDARRPVQCATCHYTPALDLAQLGPTDSPAGTAGPGFPGTEQRQHISMSRAMHGHHGGLLNPVTHQPLFPDMPNPVGRDRTLTGQIVEQTCYQCHPGKRTQCLRGAMAAAGVSCQDCHGDMRHVGNDFSGDWADTPFPGGLNLTKRVPWASEPACQSCHTGDAVSNLAGSGIAPVAPDGIRLLRAYSVESGTNAGGSPDGTEVAKVIQAVNKRFAENEGLYRLSKGHGGVMCEGCHGSTHAIYPHPLANANDNITSTQLQGHNGTVTECVTCHEPTDTGLPQNLDGPHGMHPVANYDGPDSRWNFSHKEIAERQPGVCKTCHGTDGLGTVLARTATTRRLKCKDEIGTLCNSGDQIITLAKGTAIACNMCHQNRINGGDD